MNDKSYQKLSSALRQVISRPQLKASLKSKDTRNKAIEKLKISEEIATEIINILNVIEQNQNDGDNDRKKPNLEKTDEITTDKKFMLESFVQLRMAYRISMSMSSVMFLVGLAFLIIAAVRSFVDPQSIAVTSIIGGIGVVQVVALFYKNPLIHIGRTVSNAQQAKMAVMSYLIGISLINQEIGAGKPSKENLKDLVELTETALGQLQKYTEEGTTQENKELNSTSSSKAQNN